MTPFTNAVTRDITPYASLKGGAFLDLETDFGAKGDAILLSDGAITSGTPDFASMSATFTAADVSKILAVAGCTFGSSFLTTVAISAFVDSHHVTLAENANATVAGAPCWYGTDTYTAFNHAVASIGTARSAGGGKLRINAAGYCFSASTSITYTIDIEGVGAATNTGTSPSRFLFPSATGGLNLAAPSISISNLALIGLSTALGADDGIFISNSNGALLRNVLVQGFGRYGVAVDSLGGVFGDPNCNSCMFQKVTAYGNLSHGFYVVGHDSNNCKFEACTSAKNVGFGFFNGFVGGSWVFNNHFDTCLTYLNKTGCYYENGTDNQYINCYAEPDGFSGNCSISGSDVAWVSGDQFTSTLVGLRFAVNGGGGAGGTTYIIASVNVGTQHLTLGQNLGGPGESGSCTFVAAINSYAYLGPEAQFSTWINGSRLWNTPYIMGADNQSHVIIQHGRTRNYGGVQGVAPRLYISDYDQTEAILRPGTRQLYISEGNSGPGVWEAGDNIEGVHLQRTPGTAPELTVTSATNASPIVVGFSSVHGAADGDVIQLREITGNTAANGWFKVTATGYAADHLALFASTGNGTYTGGGSAWRRLSSGVAPQALNVVGSWLALIGGRPTFFLSDQTAGGNIYTTTSIDGQLVIRDATNSLVIMVYDSTTRTWKITGSNTITGPLTVNNGWGVSDPNPQNVVLGGGFGPSSPEAGSLCFGDGSGWRVSIGARIGGGFVPKFFIYDTGKIDPIFTAITPNSPVFTNSVGKLVAGTAAGTGAHVVAASTGLIILTTSFVDVPGLSVTLTKPGWWRVEVSLMCSIDWHDGSNVAELVFAGTPDGRLMEMFTSVGNDVIYLQEACFWWVQSTTGAEVCKIRARKTLGSGNSAVGTAGTAGGQSVIDATWVHS